MKSRIRRLITAGVVRQIGGYRAESLIGDLTEEYAHGRSAFWYWRQVLVAVLTSYLRYLRLHGMTFLGAVALGAVGVEGCITLVHWLSDLMWREELATYGAALSAADLQSMELILFWGAWTPLTAVIYFVLARLIAASHSPHPNWVVGIFILLILISRLPWTVRLFLVATSDTRCLSYPVQDLIATMLCVVAAWLGGSWHLGADQRLNSITRMPPS